MDSKIDYKFGLEPEDFLTVFPFHFIFGENLKVCQVGPSSSEIFGLINGSKVSDFFNIKYPDLSFSLDEILKQSNSYFILESTKHPVNLRGQMLL